MLEELYVPVQRKREAAPVAHIPSIPDGIFERTGLPRRITLLVIVRDESGSMSTYRMKQGRFVPALLKAVHEAGGPRVGELVYVLYIVLSGGVIVACDGFVPLKDLVEPE